MSSATAGAQILTGVGVGRGAVIGPVVQVHEATTFPEDTLVERNGQPLPSEDLPAAVEDAFVTVKAHFEQQSANASGSMATVLAAAAQIAGDPALRSETAAGLDAGKAPIKAINDAVKKFVTMFEAAGPLMAERVPDLLSVRDRVIPTLLQEPLPGAPELHGPSVIVARDLAPADTAALDLNFVVAIVTEVGGPTGHTAIIAGQLGLPCIVQVTGVRELEDGTEVAVDAARSEVVVNPGSETIDRVEARQRFASQLDDDNEPCATSDGHTIDLLANIGTAADAERAAAKTDGHVVAGTGLFRTEVLFLDEQTAPSVQAQHAHYTKVLKAFAGRKVVVRTLDAGADKPLAFATQPDEDNPALGVRGYRSVRLHPEILEAQLEALARSAEETGSQPWVMAPMIATVAEARDFVNLARGYGLQQVGVMIEVPAAALRAEDILAEVDFVSLGTNDLAQYTMATDRLRGELSDLLDPWQPAVLDLVAATAAAGQELNKPVGVCGESASDPLLALVLTGLGVTSLSMSLGAVPAVRYALRNHTLEQCEQMAQVALAAIGPEEARQAVTDLLNEDVRTVLA